MTETHETAKPGLVVVTGGSRGIGAEVCRTLAAFGHPVAVNYAGHKDAAEAVVDSVTAAGGRARAIAADVSDERQVGALFKEAEAELGPLAGLVNNAGVFGETGRLAEQEVGALERLLAVNVLGPLLCCRAAVDRLSDRHGGRGGAIVNISSVAARSGGIPGAVAYAATKGAVESLTRGLANEVAREDIRVNAVAPGLVDTDMAPPDLDRLAEAGVPMGRPGQPREVAEAVAWLMSPAASYVTGTTVTMSGGR
ncbi:SDR family oxidoreductase [Streptomyces sp. NPDC001351]|uniref:SDR family oxidoreductase n=1 Tax=Streptomyces sp. NPDC001351 TaxID=3364564 RepID=UPI0036A98D6A